MKRIKIDIKPEELRIGNYVQVSDKYAHYISQIVGVKQTSVYVNSGKKSCVIPLAETEAIPLAREILTVWCGFISDAETAELKKGDIQVVLDKDGTATARYGSGGRRIKALHELQNIYYAVTGEELSVTSGQRFVEKASRPAWDLDAEMQKSIEKMEKIKSLRVGE